jgi:hypothetical protein
VVNVARYEVGGLHQRVPVDVVVVDDIRRVSAREEELGA